MAPVVPNLARSETQQDRASQLAFSVVRAGIR